MADSWPSSLPQDLITDGFSYTQQDQTIRTEMSAGPAFVRRRFTAATVPFSGSIYVDTTQHATLWSFYNNTLSGGTDPFTWKHPVTEVSASVRFTGVPTVAAAGGEFYQIAMQLEILP